MVQRIEELYKDANQAELEADRKHNWLMAFVVDFLFQTGMRRSELCSLMLNDVDRAKRNVKVTGKGSKTRIIPYGPARQN